MAGHIWIPIVVMVLLITLGALLSGTEFAVASLRESQIDGMLEEGGRAAKAAKIARDPNRFLAAVQIGITLCDFLSAAFGASVIAPALTPHLIRIGIPAQIAGGLAFAVLTLLIVYAALVFGELVPKRIAQQNATAFARLMAPPIGTFATIMSPVIWLLSQSTNAIVRLFGVDPAKRSEDIDEEELRSIIEGQGGIDADERRILSDVLDAGNRTLVEAMTPRGNVTFLPASMTLADAAELVRAQPYSRYPVIGRNFDDVLGFVHVRDVLQPPAGADPHQVRVHAVKRAVPVVPGTARAFSTMSLLRSSGTHIAVVVDEYGGTDGIVTLEDLVEEFVGDIRDEYDIPAQVHASGTFDAGLTLEEFERQTEIELPDGPYETIAGFILAKLGRIAVPGDTIQLPDDAKLTVIETVGHRITTVRLARPTTGPLLVNVVAHPPETAPIEELVTLAAELPDIQ